MEGFKKMTSDVREAREYEGMVADSRQLKAENHEKPEIRSC